MIDEWRMDRLGLEVLPLKDAEELWRPFLDKLRAVQSASGAHLVAEDDTQALLEGLAGRLTDRVVWFAPVEEGPIAIRLPIPSLLGVGLPRLVTGSRDLMLGDSCGRSGLCIECGRGGGLGSYEVSTWGW
jgi:hypothetical protein